MDYEQLFHVLKSVKDKNGKPAVFTTYAMPANVNIKETLRQGKFVPENLDATYNRLAKEDTSIFEDAVELMQEGISAGLIRPQFHGREHLNVLAFNRLLSDKNPVLMANLELNSLAGLPNHEGLPHIKFSEAFSFRDKEEIENHKVIIKDGLSRIEKVYGYKLGTFTPPVMLLHPELYSYVEELGIKAIDKPRFHQVHLGEGKYQNEKNN